MKRGLVIEGGGMRGAHSCGVLMALAQLRRTDFDVVTASSAGACTASYLVSRQYALLPVIWTKHIHGRRFIDLRKLPTRRSVMNLDYLIETVFSRAEPLDLEALRTTPTQFFISATDCATGSPHFFENHRDPILPALKASAALPIAYRGPVTIGDRAYIDGGASVPIPLQKALEEGCDDILLILTRPAGYRKKAPLINFLPRLYHKKYPQLARLFLHRHEEYNALMDRIENWDHPAKLTIIRPTGNLPVSRLTTKKEKIIAAVLRGYEDAYAVLSPGAPSHAIDLKSALA